MPNRLFEPCAKCIKSVPGNNYQLRGEVSLASQDYGEAFVYVSEAHEPPEGKTRSKIEEFHEALKLAAELGTELGVRVHAVVRVLKEVDAAMEVGDGSLIKHLSEARGTDLATVSWIVYSMVKDKVIEARNLRINIEALQLLERARQLLGEGEMYDALRLMAKCNSRTTRLILMHKEAHSVILSAAGLVSKANSKRVSVSSPLDKLLEAKKAFERMDYVAAIGFARTAEEETRNLLTLHASTHNTTGDCGGEEEGQGHPSTLHASAQATTSTREALDEVQALRFKAERISETVVRMGADASSLDGILAKAKSVQEAGELRTARGAYNRYLDRGLRLCGSHMKKLLSHATRYVSAMKPLGIDDTTVTSMLAKSKVQTDSGDFETAFNLMEEAVIEAKTRLTRVVEEALTRSETAIRQVNGLKAGGSEAERLMAEAREALEEGHFERALQSANDTVQRLERLEKCERKFAEFGHMAMVTICSARKFGIYETDAAVTLADAFELKKTDISKAMEEAEKAYQLALEPMEAFTPRLNVSFDVPNATVGEQVEGSLVVVNDGKSFATDVKIEILGDVEVEGLPEIPSLKAKGEVKLPIRVRTNSSGSLTLTIHTTAFAVDGRECSQEKVAQIEVKERLKPREPMVAELERKCIVCRGSIKIGFKVARCPACGEEFHETCASRAGVCPPCQEPLLAPS